MTLLLAILFIICLWGIKVSGFQGGFLSKDNTTAVKGVFTFLILFSHMRGYLFLTDGWINSFYGRVQDYLDQLIVVMFFFYSGFGIWESFKNKEHYEKNFFNNRIIKTLIHFDIAICLYILIQLLIPKTYPWHNYLFCWIGWEDVGNSNWFIFVILCLYLAALCALIVQRNYDRYGIGIVIALSCVLWVLLRLIARKESWWVNTIAALPLGMIVSYFKETVVAFLSDKNAPFISSAIGTCILLVAHRLWGVDDYGLVTCIFCCLVLSLTSWIHIGNPILKWAGKNAFTVYIIQRLPMIVLTAVGLNKTPGLFIPIVIILTIFFAEMLSRINSWVDSKLFS